MTNLTNLQQWQALKDHFSQVQNVKLTHLFREHSHRFRDFSLEIDGVFLDYSKNHMTHTTRDLLCQLANSIHLKSKIEQLFSGKWQNNTENCCVLHTALRNPCHKPIWYHGKNIMLDVQASLNQMEQISNRLRQGLWRGYTNKIITDIVHIGIGGSHLGPLMAYEALRRYAIKTPRVHFLSNVDGTHVETILAPLHPETTLFIIASKSFETLETKLNATLAKNWLNHHAAIQKQCIAITARRHKAIEFGIAKDHIIDIWDWVGGRYSLFSAIGLPLAIAIGMKRFREILDGAYYMDNHFRHSPLTSNMPTLLGLLGIWYHNFFNAPTYAILPYTQNLHLFPAYLQQLDMESNGKQVDVEGHHSGYQTGPIVWGQIGTNSQHAVGQTLFQGKHFIPVDFILTLDSPSAYQHHHKHLIANCLSQSQALLEGNNKQALIKEHLRQGLSIEQAQKLANQQYIPGNKPSNLICLSQLTPRILGSLIALYEHKIFVQGAIWGINSYDQCGVELAKKLSTKLIAKLKDTDKPLMSHSTDPLLHYIQQRLHKEKSEQFVEKEKEAEILL